MDPINSRKQSIKVIASEAIMVIAVIITVIILALLVSGYWLNSNFEVERGGMLQVSSLPTGANVEIDGQASSWLERTNSSKILSSGEHSIVLTKDGYDSWSKVINIAEGLLYRLHYPRLFLNDRTLEPLFDIANYTSASVSSDHGAILLMNGTTEWAYLNLDSDKPSLRKLDISKLFSTTSVAEDAKVGLFTGHIDQIDWDFDASHALIKATDDNASEWVLLDVNNVDKSVNLTKEFGANFSRIEILDNNSNHLLAVQNHNLHQIDLPGRLISAVLVDNIIDYDHYNNEVVFSAYTQESSDEKSYYVGYFKVGDNKPDTLTSTTLPAKVAISKFYDSKYITILEGQTVFVHQKDAFDEALAKYEIGFSPDLVEVGHDGEFLLFVRDHEIATLDMEANLVREWDIERPFGWLDNDMLYAVSDGKLIVYDFDGLNRRVIADNVSSRFPVAITVDKWLYYFSDSRLMREWLIPR